MRRSLPRFFIFLFVLFLYTGVQTHALLPGQGLLAWTMAAVCFAVMIPWQFGYRSGRLPVGSWRLTVLAWVGSLTFGVWGTFAMLSFPLVCGYAVAWGVGSRLSYSEAGRYLGMLSLFIGLIGWLQTVYGPRLKRVRVPIANLPPELVGLTIAQISDLHVGPTIGRRYVSNVVRKVMALKADLIAFTGDFGDGPAAKLKKGWMPLANLTAPLGKYYVTGNHEYYWGGDTWVAAAREAGFITLMNENRVVRFKGTPLTVAGVTDLAAAYFNPGQKTNCASAMSGGEGSALKILLAHQPECADEAEKNGFDLQLSGHTHGGQFFPFTFFMPFAHKYIRGLNRHKAMSVYVNVGTGYWGPPNRFAVPPEITLLTLVAA